MLFKLFFMIIQY